MTVGQKIQKLRKNANLSQEDLAEKLLVSRQTVSLWETDQTLPTIDNLRLLKVIFHVSIDELLCEEEKNESEEGTASDAEEKDEFEYSFTLTDDERVKKINKGLMFAFLEKKDMVICDHCGRYRSRNNRKSASKAINPACFDYADRFDRCR
jgi:transcriptional regulator with XRE-family HTH domain